MSEGLLKYIANPRNQPTLAGDKAFSYCSCSAPPCNKQAVDFSLPPCMVIGVGSFKCCHLCCNHRLISSQQADQMRQCESFLSSFMLERKLSAVTCSQNNEHSGDSIPISYRALFRGRHGLEKIISVGKADWGNLFVTGDILGPVH